MKWSYGITTVPQRKNNLLKQTLCSLAAVGFDSPKIFIDGEPYKFGHLANWMRTAFHLYITDPTADRFAIFEDDLICCLNLKEYLETWHPDPGYLNLLSHDVNIEQLGDNPLSGWHLSNQKGKGAVALVFDNPAMRVLLSSQVFLGRPTEERKQSADSIVCDSIKPYGYEEYIHNPGLVQHVGKESTLGHNFGEMKSFGGKDYDPTLLTERTPV